VFDVIRDGTRDLTFWRIRVWVVRQGEDRDALDRRPPDGVLYGHLGWHR
jgi:hypothetical protein